MHTDLTPEQVVANAVTLGKLLGQLLKVCDVLLKRNPVWTEQLLPRLVRALYTHRLRGLVAVWPHEMTAEILAASEGMSGVVIGLSRN